MICLRSPHARRLAAIAWLVVAVGGCTPRVGPLRPDPQPTPATDDPIADAASQAVRDYVTGLARVARETAEAAPTFKTHADASTYGAEKNKAARDAAFAPPFKLIDQKLLAIDETGKPAPYDATKTAAAFRSFAAGVERPLRGAATRGLNADQFDRRTSRTSAP